MKPSAVIIGAGGHAKVIIDILQEAGGYDLVGCLSHRFEGGSVLGVPVLGSEELLGQLYREGIRVAFAAIGDNRVRQSVARSLQAVGFTLLNAMSRHAIVSGRVGLGQGIAVMPGAVINVDTQIGDGVIVNTGATIDHDCRVGEYAHIGPGTNLAGGVHIGEGTLLGVGCRAIPGKTVGAWSVIGAGSVIVRDLPGGRTAMGNPARVKTG